MILVASDVGDGSITTGEVVVTNGGDIICGNVLGDNDGLIDESIGIGRMEEFVSDDDGMLLLLL